MLRPKPFAASPPHPRRVRIQGALLLLGLAVLLVLLAWLFRSLTGGSGFTGPASELGI